MNIGCAQSQSKKIDLQAHRGCRGLMPENTIPAMKKALDLGVTTLEMDVVITKDKQVILSHEPFFNHEITTHPNGQPVSLAEEKALNIYAMNFAATQLYDVGKRGNARFPQQTKLEATKPLLSSVIDTVELYWKQKNLVAPFYNIETKLLPSTDELYHPKPAEFVQLLMDVIYQKQIADRVIIQSFDIRTLQIIHQNHPAIKTALLIEPTVSSTISDQLNNLGFVPTIYSPHYSKVTADLIQFCHSKNIKVIPWTINDLATMQQLVELGVDGIISDYPNLFKSLQF